MDYPVITMSYTAQDDGTPTSNWTYTDKDKVAEMNVSSTILGVSDKQDYQLSATVILPNKKNVVRIIDLNKNQFDGGANMLEPHKFVIDSSMKINVPLVAGLYKVQVRLLQNRKAIANSKTYFYCRNVTVESK